MSRRKRWLNRLKLIAFALLPAIVVFGALEVLAWTAIHREIRVIGDPLTGQPYVYGMRIGRFGEWSVTPLNTAGFPDDELTELLDSDECVRVLILGDSFTFGDSVDRHENWVSLVRRAAAVHAPDRCVRFINAGERMTTIVEQLDRLRALLPVVDPDAVLLAQFQNDLSDLTNHPHLFEGPDVASAAVDEVNDPADEKGGVRRWGMTIYDRVPLGNASLVRFLSYRLSAYFITRGIEHDILDSWSVLEDPTNPDLADQLQGLYEEVYGDLVEELRGRGVEFAVLIFPSKFDVMAGRYPEGEYFSALAQRYVVPYLDLTTTFLENRRPYAFQMYDGHLNPHGNALAARQIVPWLFGEDAPLGVLLEGETTSQNTSALRGIAENNLH